MNVLCRTIARTGSVAMCIVLAGCQTAPVQQVHIPVPVPCIEVLPAEPDALPDHALARLSDPDLVVALREQQLLWRADAKAVRALLLGCLRR